MTWLKSDSLQDNGIDAEVKITLTITVNVKCSLRIGLLGIWSK